MGLNDFFFFCCWNMKIKNMWSLLSHQSRYQHFTYYCDKKKNIYFFIITFIFLFHLLSISCWIENGWRSFVSSKITFCFVCREPSIWKWSNLLINFQTKLVSRILVSRRPNILIESNKLKQGKCLTFTYTDSTTKHMNHECS